MKKFSRRGVLPELNKDYILDYVSQEDIFSRFLSIPLSDIYQCLKYNTHTYSVFRHNDKDPSLGFKLKNSGKIVCRDFGGFFWGDCFDAVAWAEGRNANDPKDFATILRIIAEEFNIHHYGNCNGESVRYAKSHKPVKRKRKVIVPEFRRWDNHDLRYFYRGGINKTNLKYHRVYPIHTFYINGYEFYNCDRSDDRCYGYYFGKDKNGIELWRMYFAERYKQRHGFERPKFVTNNNLLQYRKLRRAEHGVIIKSYKDLMTLVGFVMESPSEFDVDGLAPVSESVLLTGSQMSYLRRYWNKLYTLSDFDRTGILFGLRMAKKYNTVPLFFTNGNYGTVDFGAKDLFEYHTLLKRTNTRELIKYTMNQLSDVLNCTPDYIDFTTNFLNHKQDVSITKARADDDIPF